MTTWGDKFGRQGRPNYGVGVSLAPDELPVDNEDIVYSSFVGGLDMSDAPEDVDMTKSVFCIDMETTRADRLVRVPGVSELSEEAHSLLHIFQHASMEYDVELVAIDPPWLGYKGSGAWTWVNLALANTGLFGWNAITYLNDLLFSNGVDASYTRATGAAVVVDQSANIIARTFAQQFGRLFAGHYTVAGVANSMGIKWNDTTGAVGGWAGTGAGNERIISPDQTADYLVALRALGFDLLAILARNSLHAGYPTGKDNRPADFRFRFGGIGCVSEKTARVTPGGVTFLSDEGVVNYNVNSAQVISGPINSELLPLNYNDVEGYTAAYSSVRRRYYLQSPDYLYTYDFPIPELKIPGRWFRRSYVADSIIAYSNQAAQVAWDSLVGTWNDQTRSWDNFGFPAWAAPSSVFYTLGARFGQEDPAVNTFFGGALTPKWRTPQSARKAITDQLTTVGWEIAYSSQADASINLLTPDKDGSFGTNTVTKVLPNSLGQITRKLIWSSQTGMGLQTQIEIASGTPEIIRIRQLFQSAGPVIGSL